MATIETNEAAADRRRSAGGDDRRRAADRPGAARQRSSAIASPSAWAGFATCPTSATTPAESAKIVPQLDAIGIAQPEDARRAREGRPAGVLLAGRGPGPDRLVHGERGRRDRRVLRAPRVRQVHRRVTAVPLQGDARPAPLDGRHRCVPALDDRRARAVRRPAGGVLAVQGHELRHRAVGVLLRVRARLPGDLVLPPRRRHRPRRRRCSRRSRRGSPQACRACSASPSTARSRRLRRRAGSRIRLRARRCSAVTRCSWSATTTT